MSFGTNPADAAAVTEAPKELKLPHAKDPVVISEEDANAAVAAVEGNMNDYVAYISFGGDNANDGLSAEAPKKQLLAIDKNGVTSILHAAGGGTLVTVGKLYAGGSYAFPAFEKTLKITSNDGTTDFKNPEPITNPTCAMKIAANSIVKFTSDVIIDDIILFNEHDGATTYLAVTNNSTMVLGENIVSMNNETATNKDSGEPYNAAYMSLYVEEGSTLVVKSGTYECITGGGNVYLADGVVVENKLTQVRWNDDGSMAIEEITMPVIPGLNDPEETTAPETTPAVVDGNSEGGFPVVPVVIAAVVVVALVAVVAVVAKKKK